LINGESVIEKINIGKVSVSKYLNKISTAKIALSAKDMAAEKIYDSIEGDLFKLGNEVEIKASTGEEVTATIYKGIIVKSALSMDQGKAMTNLECKDVAIKMTIGRKNKIYTEQLDSDIIKSITSEYSDLTVKVDATNTEHPELIQYHITDWDFVNLRAEANGLQLINSDGELTITAVGAGVENKGTIELKNQVKNFNLEYDARNYFNKVKAVNWDFKNSELYSAEKSSGVDLPQGDQGSSTINKTLSENGDLLHSSAFAPTSHMDDMAQARLDRANMAKIMGEISLWASPEFIPGDIATLEGFSTRYDGDALISGVKHVIKDNTWITDLSIGLPNELYAENNKGIFSSSSNSSLAPMNGLAIGVVQKIDEDPEGQHRVQVALSTLEDDSQPIWARLSVPYVGAESGMFFFPEIGNEVVVGFMDDNPGFPIILGNLYSSNIAPKFTPDPDNKVKSLSTLAGLEINFNEEDKIIQILTPGENTITLDDDDKSIVLVDANGNEVKLGSDGISLTSDKDIILDSKGNIQLKAAKNVELEATSDLSLKGLNVAAEGSAGFEAKGPQVTVKGDAMTEISGGIVKIN
jgi:Rhs element Vgr protein